MTVSELISFLQQQPQHLTVIYRCYSEAAVLNAKDIAIEKWCEARPDGWVAHERPDKPLQVYLVLPGN